MPKAKKTKEDEAKNEKIGFHKGSLSVLAKERQEMQKILTIVEQLMQMHLTELKELGVDLTSEVAEEEAPKKAVKKKKPPIDELL